MSTLATERAINNKQSKTAASHLPAQCELSFAKIHGLGNDFVIVDAAALAPIFDVATASSQAGLAMALRQGLSTLARQVCDRNKGIGGDGLIVAVKAAHLADDASLYGQALKQFISSYQGGGVEQFSWIYINSDGSYSTMCGNGLRCLALFISRQGWTTGLPDRHNFKISLEHATVTVTVRNLSGGDSTGGGATEAVVSTLLAPPVFACAEVPVDVLQIASGSEASSTMREMVAAPIALDGGKVYGTAVSMGNPHVVIFAPDQARSSETDLDWAGYPLDMRGGLDIKGKPASSKKTSLLALSEPSQSLSLFPQGVNVEWVQVDSPSQVKVYVVERGCGPTLACASGAAAVVAAGVKQGLLKRQCCVILPGGNLDVSYLEGDMQDQIELTGNAKFVFDGKILVHRIPLVLDDSVVAAEAKG